MAKVRVHALAKELGKETSEVIAALADMGIKATAVSGIEEEDCEKLRKKFTPKAAPKASKAADAAASAAAEAGAAQTAAPQAAEAPAAPKKKKLVAVFRPQNAKSSAISKMKERPERRVPVDANGRPLKRRPVDANGRPIRRPVDANGRPLPPRRPEGARPAGERPVRPAAEAPAKPAVHDNRPLDENGKPMPMYHGGPGSKPMTMAEKTALEEEKKLKALEREKAEKEAREKAEREAAQAAKEKEARKAAAQTGNAPRRAADHGANQAGSQGRAQQPRRDGSASRKPASSNAGGRKDAQQRGQSTPARGAQGKKDGGFTRGGARPQNASGKGRGYGNDGASSKNGERNRNNARRQEKDKNVRFDRYDMNDRVQTGRKKKDPNRAGAFHKPEPVQAAPEEKIKTIVIPERITLRDLADRMKIQPAQIIKKLFLSGKMVTVNQELSYEEAEEIAVEYDILCEKEVKTDVIAELLKEDEENTETMVARPPVVCVMGHVDHGKTSLLDAIRNTHVTDRESGGITQHIGASVITYQGRNITFLDTPGHEAFTAMRLRGATSTDIAVLVVAADDGVMPQTVEAINHAKAAGIEIIVAINKIDKPGANIDRVKQELTEHELIAEDWGGSTIMVPVSAKSHEGIDTLLEMILLTADVLELKANPNRRARGLVIEARLDKGRGPVASVLVQKGTLRTGEPICAGSCYGRIRAMTDDKGRRVKEAGPSMPVEVIGFSDVPGAGEIFTSPETEKEAKNFAETFITVGREKMLEETRTRMSLNDLFSQIQEGTLKDLNLIVKADVQGSVEALRQSLLKLSNDEVIVKIIHGGVGAINESDVTLASASNAIIIGFNVRPDAQAKSTAEREGVDIRLYKVIYDAIGDIENAMKGMLEPIYEEKVTGHVEIRQIFKASGVGNIAGSYVLDGVVQRGSKARITRDGEQIFDGEIASLKRFKDDVKEVKAGYECGLVFDGFSEIREGDSVEVYVMVEVPRT